jgi:hypothetical protein
MHKINYTSIKDQFLTRTNIDYVKQELMKRLGQDYFKIEDNLISKMQEFKLMSHIGRSLKLFNSPHFTYEASIHSEDIFWNMTSQLNYYFISDTISLMNTRLSNDDNLNSSHGMRTIKTYGKSPNQSLEESHKYVVDYQ